MIQLTTPLTKDVVSTLSAGDEVLITGTVYTARDAAHMKMIEQLERTGDLPFPIKDSIIYYVGPAPAKEGQVIGSCGPTTSYRMDSFTPRLLQEGLSGMIGKGNRDDGVIQAMQQYQGVYFGAVGGAAALLAKCVKSVEIIDYPELGPEAVRALEVENFPAIVVIDAEGKNLYEIARKKYKK